MVEGSDDSDTKQSIINVFYIGDCFYYTSGVVPYIHLKEEPPFRLAAIPTWSLDLMRSMRHYMPRTYQDHIEKNDVVLMSDAVRDVFKPDLLKWFRDGVVEEGQGLLMIGGLGSFGAGKGMPSWGGSPIEEIMPCSFVDQEFYEGLGLVFPVPVDARHEFCAPLPWNEASPFAGLNIVVLKQGAVEILRPVVTMGLVRGPLLASWQIGEGMGLAHTPDLTYAWVGSFGDWEYYGDYCINLVYLLAQREVPQDISLAHAARTAMQNYAQEKALLVAMAEFVARFGANPRRIEQGIAEVVEMKIDADTHYVKQDFVAVLTKLGEIGTRIRQLGEEATELKNNALMWVFIAEWFIVTATFMIAGYVLWSLMIRRRLYRDIQVTRLQERTEEAA